MLLDNVFSQVTWGCDADYAPLTIRSEGVSSVPPLKPQNPKATDGTIFGMKDFYLYLSWQACFFKDDHTAPWGKIRCPLIDLRCLYPTIHSPAWGHWNYSFLSCRTAHGHKLRMSAAPQMKPTCATTCLDRLTEVELRNCNGNGIQNSDTIFKQNLIGIDSNFAARLVKTKKSVPL